MANTYNLNLEQISTNDKITTDFINKINSNQSKIDAAYGLLKENLCDITNANTIEDAINLYVSAEEIKEEMEEMASVGNASASDIVSGKTALVQGNSVTGTLTLGYNLEMQTTTIAANTTATGDSVTFTFDADITNARIIYQAYPNSTSMYTYYSPAKRVLLEYDSALGNVFNTIYMTSRDYASYCYRVTTGFTVTKNVHTLTITADSSYGVSAYSGVIDARCIALIPQQ